MDYRAGAQQLTERGEGRRKNMRIRLPTAAAKNRYLQYKKNK
jgi:hypothetical protein